MKDDNTNNTQYPVKTWQLDYIDEDGKILAGGEINTKYTHRKDVMSKLMNYVLGGLQKKYETFPLGRFRISEGMIEEGVI